MDLLLNVPSYCSGLESVRLFKILCENLKIASAIFPDIFQVSKVSVERGVTLIYYAPSAEKLMVDSLIEFEKQNILVTPVKRISGITLCSRLTVNVNEEDWQDRLKEQGHSEELINNITEQLALYLEETAKLALLV